MTNLKTGSETSLTKTVQFSFLVEIIYPQIASVQKKKLQKHEHFIYFYLLFYFG